MIEQQLADLTAAVKELTQAMIASKSCATSVVLSGATESPKDDGGVAAKTTKAAEKPATKTTTKAAEKPATKVTPKVDDAPAESNGGYKLKHAYTDDDVRAIAKSYLGIDDVKLREKRKEWIVGLIGELGAAQAVQIPQNYRPAFDAWVQDATRTGDCPDYEAYVDGSFLGTNNVEDAEDEV